MMSNLKETSEKKTTFTLKQEANKRQLTRETNAVTETRESGGND